MNSSPSKLTVPALPLSWRQIWRHFAENEKVAVLCHWTRGLTMKKSGLLLALVAGISPSAIELQDKKASQKRRINQKKKATVIRQRNWICWVDNKQAKQEPMGQCFILTCRKGPCTLSVKWNELVNYPPATGPLLAIFLFRLRPVAPSFAFFTGPVYAIRRLIKINCINLAIEKTGTDPVCWLSAVRHHRTPTGPNDRTAVVLNRWLYKNAERHLAITRYRNPNKWLSQLLSN